MDVDILLATYQGALYLPQLLVSLEQQTHKNWRLLVRDDGSNDRSCCILKAFHAMHPDRVVILPAGKNGGAVANFAALMEASTAPYIMFCDQDDVWDIDKVAVSLEAIQKHERVGTQVRPCLVHTDLRVADATLRPLSSSFWHYAKLLPKGRITLSSLLVQNVVTGCATICNRALIEKALPIPTAAIMHDWWLALVAVAFGILAPLDRATITYRQHGSNAIGAQQFGTMKHLKRAWRQLRRLSAEKQAQTEAFLHHYKIILTAEQRETLSIYLSLPHRHGLVSRYLSWRHGFYKQGLLRQLAALVLLKQP